MKPVPTRLGCRVARCAGIVLAAAAWAVAARAQTILTWNGGDILTALGITTVIGGNTINIATGNDHDFNGRTISNSGVANWNAGNLRSGNNGAFVNAAGGVVNVTADGYGLANPFGGSFVFTNNGTLNRSGTGATSLGTTFDNTGTVNVTGGQLTLSGGGTSTGAFNVSGTGSLLVITNGYTLGAGSSLNGAIRITGGTLTANGTIPVAGASFQGGNLQGTQTFSGGTLAWSGGNWNGSAAGPATTFASTATVNLGDTNDSTRDFNFRSITNNGVVNWNAGYLRGGNGSVFTNAAGATFNDLNVSGYTVNNPFGGAFTFVNDGTYVRNASGTTFFDTPFNNNGTINLQQGDVQFRAGGALAAGGTINAVSGTHVYFTNGYAIANGASLTGAGNYNLTGGTLTVTGTMNVSTFNQTNGTLAGVNTINGTYNWSGGNWNSSTITDTTTIGPSAVLNLSDANSNIRDFNFRSITNNGVVNWSSGYLRGGNGSVFTNAVGAVFNDFNASAYTINNPFGGTFTFVNNGTYNRNAANASYFDTTFNNNGTINLQQGEIYFRGGGTLAAAGTINTSANTRVYFTNDYTIANGASLVGPGTYNLTGGTLTAAGTMNVSTFNQTAGALAGINTINGTYNWSGGNWNASATTSTTTIAATGVLNLSDANSNIRDFNFRSITNNGVVNWSSAYLRGGNGSVFTNAAGATFNDRNASSYTVNNPFGGTFTFVNNGNYVRNATGTTYFDTPFNNNAVVDVQKGDLQIRGGGTMSSTGSITAATGSNVYFTQNYDIADAASLGGGGVYWLTGGTLSATGSINLGTFKQTGGTLAGTNVIRGNFTWSGGNWNAGAFGPSTTIGSGGILNLTDADSNIRDFNLRSITNQGTVNWSSGYIRAGNGSIFTNAAGATFNDLNTPGYTVNNPFGGAFTFVNNGTYNRNVGGTSYFDVPFNNNGTVNLSVGDLRLRAGGTMSASSIVNGVAGSHLYFTSDYTLADGAQFTGTGTFQQLGGTLTINGALKASAFTWSGGNWNAANNSGLVTTIAPATVLNLTDADSNVRDFNGRSITNQGTVNWSSGYLRGGNGSVFTNATGATFNDLNAPAYTINNPFGGSFTFVNDGLYVRNAANTTYFDTPFNNNGTVSLLAGDIRVRAGGTMSATSVVSAAAGTHLYFTADYTLAHGAQFTGAGTFQQLGGTLTIDGTLKAPAFTWSGGNWNAANNSGRVTTIGATTVLNLTDADSNVRDFNGRGIVNQGVVNWSSAYLRSGNGGSFTNALGATFNDLNAPGYTVNNPFGGSFVFTNDGNYVRNVSGTTYFDTTFNNNGTVNLQSGDIQLRAGGTMSATSVVNASAGTHLYFTTDYALLDGAQLLGSGVFQQLGGTLVADGMLRASSFTWSGGNWNAANNSGLVTTIASGTTLELTDSTNNIRDFNGRGIANDGTVNWNSGYLRSGNGGTFVNRGVFNDLNGAGYTVNNPFGGTFTFTNSGVYNKTTSGTTVFSVPFLNTNGTILAAAGTLRFSNGFTPSGGTINVSSGAVVHFDSSANLPSGLLAGNGSITGNVTNGGTIAPGQSTVSNGIGTLTFNNALTLTNTSLLSFQLGGTSSYDKLVAPTVALNGSLHVTFANGFQNTITAADTFTLITTNASGLTGTFAGLPSGGMFGTADGLGYFIATYNANSVVISGFSTVPEPSTYALFGVGLVAVAGWVRRKRK